jgi:hypothetical protein
MTLLLTGQARPCSVVLDIVWLIRADEPKGAPKCGTGMPFVPLALGSLLA